MNRVHRDKGRAPSASLPDLRLVAVFMAVVVGCAFLDPIFLTGANIQSALTTYVVEIALVTAGQTFVMLTGGIDLSVAGTVSVVGVCVGSLSASGVPTAGLICAGIAIGIGCGLLNGLLVTRMQVPPIMVTLATGILFRGVAAGLANGKFYAAFPSQFIQLGQGKWFGLASQVWVAAVVLLLAGVGVSATRQGRWVYATGSNQRAATLSGVPTVATRTAVYVLSGSLSAVAALVMTARLSSASPGMGVGLELASITAAVLGGVSVFGGKGSIFASIIGVVTIAALKSGLTLSGVASDVQNMGVAALLLFVLLVSRISLPALLRAWHLRADEPSRASSHGAPRSPIQETYHEPTSAGDSPIDDHASAVPDSAAHP